MRKIRRLADPKNIVKTEKKIKVREMPKIHISKGEIRDSRGCYVPMTWCGISGRLPTGDNLCQEAHYIYYLKLPEQNRKFCSCCDNRILSSIRCRMAGI